MGCCDSGKLDSSEQACLSQCALRFLESNQASGVWHNGMQQSSAYGKSCFSY